MKRGDIIVINTKDNVGKPRPALIIQNNILNGNNHGLNTTIVLPLTSEIQDIETFRYTIKPTTTNGLKVESQIMIDKISQVLKTKIQKVVGQITKKQLSEIESILLAVLGIK